MSTELPKRSDTVTDNMWKDLGFSGSDTFKDEFLAKILFLLLNPDEEYPFNLNGNLIIRNTIERFGTALREESIESLPGILFSRLCTLLEEDNSEDGVLIFHDICKILSITVPPVWEEKFNDIVKARKISVPIFSEDEQFKSFFIYSDMKVYSEICDLLTAADIYQIYLCIRRSDENNFLDNVNLNIEQKVLETVPGLKDVAFYFIILTLIKKQLINRVHTHILEDILKRVQESVECKDNRFIEALAKLDKYPVCSQPPGLCIIFCMEEDRGNAAVEDKNKVKSLFGDKYKYDLIVKVNPTAEKICYEAKKLRNSKYKFYDSLIVVFMGHGCYNKLKVSGKTIDLRKDFIELFLSILWFKRKPKLFFIQACANEEDVKRESDSSIPSDPYGSYLSIFHDNCYSDTLISFATKWHEDAARLNKGTLYIETLVDQLENNDQNKSIDNVLRKVNYLTNTVSLSMKENSRKGGTKKWKQSPYHESSLRKDFVFPRRSS